MDAKGDYYATFLSDAGESRPPADDGSAVAYDLGIKIPGYSTTGCFRHIGGFTAIVGTTHHSIRFGHYGVDVRWAPVAIVIRRWCTIAYPKKNGASNAILCTKPRLS